MGGAPCCEGNVTPAAEFNIWVDPEAARMVFLSGMRCELVGWQLSRFEAVINQQDIDQIRALGTALGHFAVECNSHARYAYKIQTSEDGICLPDPVAMSIAIDPTIGTEWSDHYIHVEAAHELTRGMTLVDRLNVGEDERNRETWKHSIQAGRTRICWKLDNNRWKEALLNALR
jgi:purine nucleosidase